MTPQQRRSPARDRATPSATATVANFNSIPTSEFDYDTEVVAQVESSIWQAIYDGHFRLAVKCDVCGRWLTSSRSKKAHRGPRCSARAADAA